MEGVKYFEDFVVGEVEESDETYVVTAEEIQEVGRRWDPQPFHIDPEAAEASFFGGLVASSVHLFAIGVDLAYRAGAKGGSVAAVSALGFDKLRLHAPVHPGDVLHPRGTTIETRLSGSRPGTGIQRGLTELVNQDGVVVFSYESAALLECRPAG